MNPFKPPWAEVSPKPPEPPAPDNTPLVIATGIFNILVPLFFVLFVWEHGAAFVLTLRISNLIILAKVVLDLQYYVRRSTAPFVSTSAYAWLVALCGTIAPMLFRPTFDDPDYAAATLMQLVGLAMQIYLIRTLDLSFQTTVARRGIRRDGPYRLVRHPLYLTFILSQYGYLLNHTTFYNLMVCTLAIFFQVLRIKEEERLLRDDEEFQAYAEQTPWRICPGVF